MHLIRTGNYLLLLLALGTVSACGNGDGNAAGEVGRAAPGEAATGAKESSGSRPSYACSAHPDSEIEDLICRDENLAALDRKMSEVYAEAGATEKARSDTYFKASQRGWIKGRNECWKAQDKRECVAGSYKRRIAELQARYALVPSKGPVTYLCDGAPLTATYYETEPPSAVASFKGEESFLLISRAASGSKYVGRNESIWEHQGEAAVVWGYGAPEMRCKRDR